MQNTSEFYSAFQPLASFCLSSFLLGQSVSHPLLLSCIHLALLHSLPTAVRADSPASCQPLSFARLGCVAVFLSMRLGVLITFPKASYSPVHQPSPALGRTLTSKEKVKKNENCLRIYSHHIPLRHQPGIGDTGPSTAVCFRVWPG